MLLCLDQVMLERASRLPARDENIITRCREFRESRVSFLSLNDAAPLQTHLSLTCSFLMNLDPPWDELKTRFSPCAFTMPTPSFVALLEM